MVKEHKAGGTLTGQLFLLKAPAVNLVLAGIVPVLYVLAKPTVGSEPEVNQDGVLDK